MENKIWKMIGTMSGTSGDGLDLAYCDFVLENGVWDYRIQFIETLPYPDGFIEKLKDAHALPPEDYRKLDEEYALLNAERLNDFMHDFYLEQIDAIVSHGHTVYHEPGKKSLQLGNGQIIANETKVPVVCNLRTADVEKGGQGAPIVPIGDLQLFQDYRFCLNLGGIANISVKTGDEIFAWDICGCNLMLNELASMMGYGYDHEGHIAAEAETNQDLLKEMLKWPYLKKSNPKSLERLEVLEMLYSFSDFEGIVVQDTMSTVVDFIVESIAMDIEKHAPLPEDQILVTGGGVHNYYLMDLLSDRLPLEVVIPAEEIVNYKEALVMAFFGVLHLRKEPNCLPSVTGASEAVSGGELFVPEGFSMNKLR